MFDLLKNMMMCVIVFVILAIGFKFYKNSSQAVIDQADRSMQITYPYGSYKQDTSLVKTSDLKQGDVVSYWLTNAPSIYRVARVTALEGDRIEIANGVVKVNGVVSLYKVDQPDRHFPEVKVPRGCVFLLADASSVGIDSLQIGPVPFFQIIGRL
ncbi:MAG: signal peptidase I [Planctomycetota bacterium]